MYTFAYLLLVASFICAIACSAAALWNLNKSQISDGTVQLIERGLTAITNAMTLASIILLYAFISYDFSVEYVYQYSDLTLPLFYRITAFWAGQAGSLLFWAWSVVISGMLFAVLPSYKKLTPSTKLWYWVFFMLIMAFFLILMILWSNPFTLLPGKPANGQGLNPLLQNPGMIFHPPLLFLGYGGFVVPGCLALAQLLTGNLTPKKTSDSSFELSWAIVSRPFILVAWSLLTAGIILGAWWAYMELGWGGYWAWDPVENASLIPWLVATAYLHTGIVEAKRGKLRRINVFLMALTTISAFFATYLVRSGVIESLHAFGDGGVGMPLLIFVLASTAFITYVCSSSQEIAEPLEDAFSKEGLLCFITWILLALSIIILIATMWPVIIASLMAIAPYMPKAVQSLFPTSSMGLPPAFYNRTCLPLFAMISLLLLVCPLRKWKQGFTSPALVALAAGIGILLATLSYGIGITHPVALLGIGAACGAITILAILFITQPQLLKLPATVAAHGVHFGLLLIVIGVAFSGPYQSHFEFALSKEKPVARMKGLSDARPRFFGDASGLPFHTTYTVKLNNLFEGESQINAQGVPNYEFLEAQLEIYADNKLIGIMQPQRRFYANFEKQPFAEVSTLFSFSNEIYATLMQLDRNGNAHLSININPLVNWLWIGGILMCVFPLIPLIYRRKKQTGSPESEIIDPSA